MQDEADRGSSDSLLAAWSFPQLKTEPTITIPPGPMPTMFKVVDLMVGRGAPVNTDDSLDADVILLNDLSCAVIDTDGAGIAPEGIGLDGNFDQPLVQGILGGSARGIAPMRIGGRREIITTLIGPNFGKLVYVVDALDVACTYVNGT
jgi:hypothetical protein